MPQKGPLAQLPMEQANL